MKVTITERIDLKRHEGKVEALSTLCISFKIDFSIRYLSAYKEQPFAVIFTIKLNSYEKIPMDFLQKLQQFDD